MSRVEFRHASHARTHKAPTPCGRNARPGKFVSRPAVFGFLPQDKLWSPSKKLATSPWELVGVRHRPGKCELHTRKISQKELEAMYLNEIELIAFVRQDAGLRTPQNSKELVRFDVATKASWIP